MSVNMVDTVSPKMIESPSDVQIGFESVNGIIPRTVQIDVRNTGSRRVLTASMILSLNSIPSLILALILSNRIIPFRTTIPKSATRPMSPGNESGCPKRTSPINTPISESGMVVSTSTDCLYESKRITSVTIMNRIPNINEVKRLFMDLLLSSLDPPTVLSYPVGSLYADVFILNAARSAFPFVVLSAPAVTEIYRFWSARAIELVDGLSSFLSISRRNTSCHFVFFIFKSFILSRLSELPLL